MNHPFFSDPIVYYQLRRRFRRASNDPPDETPSPRPPSKLSRALLAYAEAHNGLVNTLEAEKELGRPASSLRACLKRLGAPVIAPNTYKMPAEEAP